MGTPSLPPPDLRGSNKARDRKDQLVARLDGCPGGPKTAPAGRSRPFSAPAPHAWPRAAPEDPQRLRADACRWSAHAAARPCISNVRACVNDGRARARQRIRFTTDFTVRDQQVETNVRRLSFVYRPETPADILGRSIDFLASISVLGVSYGEIFQTLHVAAANEQTRLHLTIMVNGIVVGAVYEGAPPGLLASKQAHFALSEVFSRAPSVYRSTAQANHSSSRSTPVRVPSRLASMTRRSPLRARSSTPGPTQ